jgi:hypothetical protein
MDNIGSSRGAGFGHATFGSMRFTLIVPARALIRAKS